MSRFKSVTETEISVKAWLSYQDYEVYRGDDTDKAEQFEACLDMVIEIVESLIPIEQLNIAQIQMVWEILECNSHIPEEF